MYPIFFNMQRNRTQVEMGHLQGTGRMRTHIDALGYDVLHNMGRFTVQFKLILRSSVLLFGTQCQHCHLEYFREKVGYLWSTTMFSSFGLFLLVPWVPWLLHSDSGFQPLVTVSDHWSIERIYRSWFINQQAGKGQYQLTESRPFNMA